MKSAYRIAKEIGVTPQAIYKRLTPDFKAQLANHIVKKNNITLFDDIAEQQIRQAFNKVDQSSNDIMFNEPYESSAIDQGYESSIDSPLNAPNSDGIMIKMLNKQQQEMVSLLNKFDRFVDVLEQPIKQSLNRNDEREKQLSNNSLVDHLQDENKFLRTQNKTLTEELKTEREHGRSQAVKLSELMTQYSDITRNQQVLLGWEQGLNNPKAILKQAEDEGLKEAAATSEESQGKTGFWQRILGRR